MFKYLNTVEYETCAAVQRKDNQHLNTNCDSSCFFFPQEVIILNQMTVIEGQKSKWMFPSYMNIFLK